MNQSTVGFNYPTPVKVWDFPARHRVYAVLRRIAGPVYRLMASATASQTPARLPGVKPATLMRPDPTM